jgi:diguanylate cyclase (GGDEF)-like protein
MGDDNQPRGPMGETSEGQRILASRSRLHRPIMVAAMVGLTLSLLAAYAVAKWEQRISATEFGGAAATELIVLQNGINEYLSRLVALRTLFESANEEITRSEFDVFSRRLFENHPGLLRVGWLPKIYRKERGAYEAAAAMDGVAGYQIKAFTRDGEILPAPQSDQYLPVYYSTEPKTSQVYGLDYSTEPVRWATMQRSRDHDSIAAIPTRLFYDSLDGKQSIMVSVPVYGKGTSRATIADRRRNLNGYIVGMFDLPQLLRSIRTTMAVSSEIDILTYPPDSDRSDGAPSWSHPDYSSAPFSARSIKAILSGPHWLGSLMIGDANWQLLAVPAEGGRLAARYNGAVITFCGGLIVTLGVLIYFGLVSRNARQIAQANQRVLELARIDALTGLPNRRIFLEQLEAAVVSRARSQGERFSVLMLDLDRFKNVNDTLGHAAGDALLREVASRLRAALRGTDLLARLGGDEFAIILWSRDDHRQSALHLAARLCQSIAETFALAGRQVEIGTSIGIALVPEHGLDPEQLLKKADLALYRSKAAGRNCFTLYDDAMLAELEARNTLESDLREAIARAQFEVHYQPFFDVQSGERRGFEALVRWRHPVRGLVPPDQFIPLAEESGLIVALGEWVLRRACADASVWPNGDKVAVNLSSVQFKQADLFDVIQSALRTSGLSPQRLELELTESVLLEREQENQLFMQKLRAIGISLALDDFGTGYSSLSCLTTFPFDKIKIDKSFIRNLSMQPKSSAIILSVVALARGLDMLVTAEGVETPEQFERLRTMGVTFAQGFLLGRPLPVSELDQQRRSFDARQHAA